MSIVELPPIRGRGAPLRVRRPDERRSVSRSATRALDVLEYFGELRRPLRSIEIARRLSMPTSTANQLLKTMVDSAHLVFDARNKTYFPSPRLAPFCTWAVESYGIGGRIRGLLRDVHAQTGVVVTASTPHDLFMQVIDMEAPEGQVPQRGLQVSLFGSAIGSAHLSTLDEGEIRRLADRARVRPAEIPAILKRVSDIRTVGYAHGGRAHEDIWSIAMPLPDLAVPTVLGLAGSRDFVRARLAELTQIMQAAIDRWVKSSVG